MKQTMKLRDFKLPKFKDNTAKHYCSILFVVVKTTVFDTLSKVSRKQLTYGQKLLVSHVNLSCYTFLMSISTNVMHDIFNASYVAN